MHCNSLFAAVTFARGHRQRTFVLNAWFLGAFVLALPLLTAGYFGATAYLVWHDELLASLMTRQSVMQYGYEDRIAALKSALDQETGRGNADRLMLETSLHDLAMKSERLESRAATIDDMVARLIPAGTFAPTSGSFGTRGFNSDGPSRGGAALRSGGLRLENHAEAGDNQTDTAVTTLVQARTTSVGRDIDHVADRQTEVLAALAGPMVRSVERMTTAFAKTGLSLDRRHASRDVGGPFVPLPPGDRDFEQTAALLRDATARQTMLVALIGRVPLRKPLAGPLDVTSTFGARLDPFFGRPAMHTGIDLRDTLGAAVAATAGGIVTIAGVDGGYGNLVEIDHGDGLRTRYAHLGHIDVTTGQNVVPGTIVGHVGSTGRATGPHLHYEVRVDSEPVDPNRFLKAGADLFPG